MEKTIEIPLGAKDSELKGWEYTIPEGMKAEIKDGKIIVREKESEDERIIDRIKKAVNDYWSDEPLNEILAWLEKQGEQKEQRKHVWTLQDAAPGDILNSTRVQATIIFKGFNPDGKHIDAYCALQNGIFIHQELPWDMDFEPAPRFWIVELFRRMNESGYMWNPEMEELKKIEQKPAWKSSDEQIEYLAKAMDEANKRKDMRELNPDAFTKEVSADNQALLDAAKDYKERTPFQYPNQLQPAYEAFIAGAQWHKQYWDKK